MSKRALVDNRNSKRPCLREQDDVVEMLVFIVNQSLLDRYVGYTANVCQVCKRLSSLRNYLTVKFYQDFNDITYIRTVDTPKVRLSRIVSSGNEQLFEAVDSQDCYPHLGLDHLRKLVRIHLKSSEPPSSENNTVFRTEYVLDATKAGSWKMANHFLTFGSLSGKSKRELCTLIGKYGTFKFLSIITQAFELEDCIDLAVEAQSVGNTEIVNAIERQLKFFGSTETLRVLKSVLAGVTYPILDANPSSAFLWSCKLGNVEAAIFWARLNAIDSRRVIREAIRYDISELLSPYIGVRDIVFILYCSIKYSQREIFTRYLPLFYSENKLPDDDDEIPRAMETAFAEKFPVIKNFDIFKELWKISGFYGWRALLVKAVVYESQDLRMLNFILDDAENAIDFNTESLNGGLEKFAKSLKHSSVRYVKTLLERTNLLEVGKSMLVSKLVGSMMPIVRWLIAPERFPLNEIFLRYLPKRKSAIRNSAHAKLFCECNNNIITQSMWYNATRRKDCAEIFKVYLKYGDPSEVFPPNICREIQRLAE